MSSHDNLDARSRKCSGMSVGMVCDAIVSLPFCLQFRLAGGHGVVAVGKFWSDFRHADGHFGNRILWKGILSHRNMHASLLILAGFRRNPHVHRGEGYVGLAHESGRHLAWVRTSAWCRYC